MLNGIALGTNIQYQWSPTTYMANNNTLTPTIQPKDTISYTLTVTSNSGCGTASSKVFVRVYQKVIVPNAFSPNGDGINEGWNIEKIQTYKNCQVTVFNRYGQIVFRSEGYYKQWDGKYNGIPVPAGTYYYTLDLKNGTKILNGWVAILR
jgi:gliding motility-associated-like protein